MRTHWIGESDRAWTAEPAPHGIGYPGSRRRRDDNEMDRESQRLQSSYSLQSEPWRTTPADTALIHLPVPIPELMADIRDIGGRSAPRYHELKNH